MVARKQVLLRLDWITRGVTWLTFKSWIVLKSAEGLALKKPNVPDLPTQIRLLDTIVDAGSKGTA